MGYHSNVAFVVPEDAPRFEKIENAFDVVASADGYRLYHAKWVKWYSGCQVVDAVNEYMDKLDEADCEGNYRFIECGDTITHIIERGELYDNPFGLCLVVRPDYSVDEQGEVADPLFKLGDRVRLKDDRYDLVGVVDYYERLDGYFYRVKPLSGSYTPDREDYDEGWFYEHELVKEAENVTWTETRKLAYKRICEKLCEVVRREVTDTFSTFNCGNPGTTDVCTYVAVHQGIQEALEWILRDVMPAGYLQFNDDPDQQAGDKSELKGDVDFLIKEMTKRGWLEGCNDLSEVRDFFKRTL